jgi:hypothetical protein
MATQLTEAEAEELLGSASRRGRRYGYPWSEWSNGAWWTLKQGEDFTTKLESFRVTAYEHATSRGLGFESHKTGDDTLMVRFFPKDDEVTEGDAAAA